MRPPTASCVGAAILLSLPQMLVAQVTPVRRPIPYPVVPSLEFQLAIENGTRTETGEPGPAYWQQWTDYELSATLDPDEKRVMGSARITHFNRFTLPLPVVALHLHQNVHAVGAVRNTPVWLDCIVLGSSPTTQSVAQIPPLKRSIYGGWANRGTLECPAGWCHSRAPAFS